MKKVTIYSKTYCPYCVKAKNLLDAKGVVFSEINIENNPKERDIMLSKSNGAKTVPQIFIEEHRVGGFDDLNALNEKGELDNLLKI